MNDERKSDEQPHGMNLGDIYFVLFRHKWVITFFCVLAVVGAVTLFAVKPPRYETEAKLFIRYVVAGKSLNAPGSDLSMKLLNDQEASIIDTEAQTITSLDVVRQAVDAVGPERILAKMGGGTNHGQADALVMQNLTVEPPSKGSVIRIIFQHPDADIAQEVLNKVIIAYINKHKEMHQPVAMFGDFLMEKIKNLRDQIAETDRELKTAKNKAGVATSLDETKRTYAEQIAKIGESLLFAQVELAGREAMLGESTNSATGKLDEINTQSPVPPEKIEEYKEVCSQLDLLSKTKQERLVQFKESSPMIIEIRDKMAEVERRKKKLQQDYPKLATLIIPPSMLAGQPTGTIVDLAAEAGQVRVLKSRIEVLKAQLERLQAEVAKVDEMEETIQRLQRKKELLEADLKFYLNSLEQAQTEEALGTGKAPNIGIMQSPVPPAKRWSKSFKKKVTMATMGCALSGFVMAFLIELLLDRSVKRPIEVETKLRLPLFISIPDISRNGNRRLAKPTKKKSLLLTDAKGKAANKGLPEENRMMQITAVGGRAQPLRRFYEGLRDRLIVYFEVHNLTQKPKLVGVTSCGQGAGVTTIAAGLAASLSETGDGNVLLVDMNVDQETSQEFYKGKPSCKLDDTLVSEIMEAKPVQVNPCVTPERTDDNKLAHVLPSRFENLMPKLKAGHYDYIIFDLPPVSQTSMTPRLARIMDMVLLVIESEKTNQDVVKRATALLAESKVSVNAVLNKNRTYVPTWLHQEFLNES